MIESVGKAQLMDAIAALQKQLENNPKGLAAALVEEAWDEPDAEDRRELAMQVLELDPSNSDAMVLLAEFLPVDSPEIMQLLEEALRIAEEGLGDLTVDSISSPFPETPEEQSYLKARIAFAEVLHQRGEVAAAMEHYRELIEEYPAPEVGLHHLPILLLLEQGELDKLEQLLRSYPDEPSATWRYSWTLLSFRREGGSVAAWGYLSAALKRNAFVPDYLLGKRTLPKTISVQQQAGGRGEAQDYVRGYGQAWRATPGALDWLRDSVKASGGT